MRRWNFLGDYPRALEVPFSSSRKMMLLGYDYLILLSSLSSYYSSSYYWILLLFLTLASAEQLHPPKRHLCDSCLRRVLLVFVNLQIPGQDSMIGLVTFADQVVRNESADAPKTPKSTDLHLKVRLTVSKVGGTHLCEGGMPLPPGRVRQAFWALSWLNCHGVSS